MERPFLKFVHGQNSLNVREELIFALIFAKKFGKIFSGFLNKHETCNRKE